MGAMRLAWLMWFTCPVRRVRYIFMVAMCHPVLYELTSISFFIPLNCTPSTQVGHVNTYASIRMRMSSKAPRATPPPPRRLTMKQIGHLAGVSQSTVSRVLSGAASIVPVADDTRARILQVVADSGYSP